MAKFFGEVGYGISVENPPGSGIWVDQITEQSFYGDVERNATELVAAQAGLNDNLVISNRISIVADQEAIENFANIRYVRWAGTLWMVKSVEVQRPRLVLSLGSVYNGPTP